MNKEDSTRLEAAVKEYYGRIAVGEMSSCGCTVPESLYASPQPGPHTAPHAAAGPDSDPVPVPEPKLPNLGCGSPLDFASVAEGMTVVDLGSGSGRELFRAAAWAGPSGRLIGVDMTPAMIDLSRRNASALKIGNAEFLHGRIDDIPLADRTADRVISNCVLNLTPDKKRSFREVFRILKPGGRLSISDIVATGPLPAQIAGSIDAWCGCVAGAIPREEYIGAIREAGFTEVTVVAESGGCSCGDHPLASITVTAVR
jgi:SAM-dependent methyltransferase